MNFHNMHIASAVQMNGGKSNLDLSAPWLGTLKIGQILPIFRQAVVPGDKLNVKLGCFSRFLPLVVPSYVDLTFRTLSVFVPYHQVFDGAESYFSNQAYFRGVANDLPKFSLSDIGAALIKSDMSTSQGSSSTGADFQYNTQYYKLTAKGEYARKLLNSLGFQLPSDLSASAKNWSWLPLLAFAHAYNCYLSYSPRVNTSSLSKKLETFKRNSSSAPADMMYTILSSILLTYEESFFSLAWNTPFYSQGLTSGQVVDVKRSDVTPSGMTVGTIYDETEGARPDGLNDANDLTAAQIRLMLKFDDYFRRTNYAGSKDIEQIYSRFGVKIDDYKTRYPYFLNESAQNVRIGDVTATADTPASGVVLGAYAGKAILSEDAGFNFEAHDYGMVFTFAWFAPRPVYYLGNDREFSRIDPFDYYTPELDQGFPEAVKLGRLNGTLSVSDQNQTFGYVPLYSDYLYYPATIVGDFRRITGFDSWHFGRNYGVGASARAQTDDFIYMPCSGTPLERIFSVLNPSLVDLDSIYMQVHIKQHADRPMKDFVGKTGLGSGNVDVPQLGYQAN